MVNTNMLLKPAVTVLFFLLILAALFIVVAPHFGWRVDRVYSGSMEPAIRTGDLIVTEPVSLAQIQVGDVITFASPKGYISHRVVSVESIEGDPVQFLTRGDSNDGPDISPVAPENVVGKVICDIPMAGYISQFIRTPLGLILTILVPGLLIVGMELNAMYFGGNKE